MHLYPHLHRHKIIKSSPSKGFKSLSARSVRRHQCPPMEKLASLFFTTFADPSQECVFGGLCIKISLILVGSASADLDYACTPCPLRVLTPKTFRSIPPALLLTLEYGRCPEDCAFGQLSPSDFPSLQEPPVRRHTWVTVEGARFHVTCGSSTAVGFALNQRLVMRKRASLSNLSKMSSAGGNGFGDKKTKEGFPFCVCSSFLSDLFFYSPIGRVG